MSALDIYQATLTGLDFITERYTEPIAIKWPCGTLSKLTGQTLYDLGDAIAEHMLECQECQN